MPAKNRRIRNFRTGLLYLNSEIGDATVVVVASPLTNLRNHSESRFIAIHHRLEHLKRMFEAVNLGMPTSQERLVQVRCTVPEDQVAYSMTLLRSGCTPKRMEVRRFRS